MYLITNTKGISFLLRNISGFDIACILQATAFWVTFRIAIFFNSLRQHEINRLINSFLSISQSILATLVSYSSSGSRVLWVRTPARTCKFFEINQKTDRRLLTTTSYTFLFIKVELIFVFTSLHILLLSETGGQFAV